MIRFVYFFNQWEHSRNGLNQVFSATYADYLKKFAQKNGLLSKGAKKAMPTEGIDFLLVGMLLQANAPKGGPAAWWVEYLRRLKDQELYEVVISENEPEDWPALDRVSTYHILLRLLFDTEYTYQEVDRIEINRFSAQSTLYYRNGESKFYPGIEPVFNNLTERHNQIKSNVIFPSAALVELGTLFANTEEKKEVYKSIRSEFPVSIKSELDKKYK